MPVLFPTIQHTQVTNDAETEGRQCTGQLARWLFEGECNGFVITDLRPYSARARRLQYGRRAPRPELNYCFSCFFFHCSVCIVFVFVVLFFRAVLIIATERGNQANDTCHSNEPLLHQQNGTEAVRSFIIIFPRFSASICPATVIVSNKRHYIHHSKSPRCVCECLSGN